MAAKKEVAKTEEAQYPVGVDFLADSGAGMETADKDSFAIPFLRVLQNISPQVDEADPEYIEDARGGMLFDSASRKLFDGKEGVIIVPCAFQRRFLQWAPRGSGGGYKGEFLPEEVVEMAARGEIVEYENRYYFPDANGAVDPKKCDHLMDTRSHFVLIIDPETGYAAQALFPLSSTQIKKSKALMTALNNVRVKASNGQMVKPPTWMSQFRLTTVKESNDQGSWYGVKLEPAGFVQSADIYAQGKEFYEAISSGEARVNYEQAVDGASNEAGEEKF